MGDYKYCDQYGLNEAARTARLKLLGLSEADTEVADLLSRIIIAPRIDEIVRRFYEELETNAAYGDYLNRASSLDRLRQTQTVYLLSLGQDFSSAEYFEERLRVGLAHARIGLPLHLYECAFNKIRHLILEHVPEEIQSDANRYRDVISFLSRITSLDMSLAIETYHLSKVGALQESIRDLKLEDEELRYKIATDSLTEVASHSQALAVLQRALQLAKRNGRPLCVCMIDLDHFKRINDTYGHLVGDAVLRDVSARMQAAVRGFDTIGRFGGEEFVIILENTPLKTAVEVIERVRKRVGTTPINVSGTEVKITLSAGITVMKSGDSVDTLIGRADSAMYSAKNAGRDRVNVEDIAA